MIDLGCKGNIIFEYIYIIFVKIDTHFYVFFIINLFLEKKQNINVPKKTFIYQKPPFI
jgi:hypothetical protein